MGSVGTIIGLATVGIIALGWIVLLVIGIIRIKRRRRAGVVLTVIGGIWGLLALSLLGFGTYTYQRAMRVSRVEDFDPEQYEGEMGSIVLPYKGESSLEVQDKESQKRMGLSTTNGTVLAPAGAYDLYSYEVIDEDGNGAKWTASGSLSSVESREISIEAGSTQDLEIGPAFTAKVTVKKKGQDEAVLDFKLIGRGGGNYTITGMDKGRKAPGFQVVDKSGDILWQGKFEYG